MTPFTHTIHPHVDMHTHNKHTRTPHTHTHTHLYTHMHTLKWMGHVILTETMHMKYHKTTKTVSKTSNPDSRSQAYAVADLMINPQWFPGL